MKAELRRGHRRYAGTDRGDQFKRVLAWQTDENPTDPLPDARTIGDLVAPERPLRSVDAVNVTSKELGTDAAEWSVVRILSLLARVEREARARD